MFEPLLSFCDDADQCNSSGELLLNQTFDEEDEEEMLADKPSFWNECMQEIVALQRRNEQSKRELQAERDKSQLLSRLTWEVSSVSHPNAPSFMAYIRFVRTYRVERWVSSYAFSRWKEKSRRARVSEDADVNVVLCMLDRRRRRGIARLCLQAWHCMARVRRLRWVVVGSARRRRSVEIRARCLERWCRALRLQQLLWSLTDKQEARSRRQTLRLWTRWLLFHSLLCSTLARLSRLASASCRRRQLLDLYRSFREQQGDVTARPSSSHAPRHAIFTADGDIDILLHAHKNSREDEHEQKIYERNQGSRDRSRKEGSRERERNERSKERERIEGSRESTRGWDSYLSAPLSSSHVEQKDLSSLHMLVESTLTVNDSSPPSPPL